MIQSSKTSDNQSAFSRISKDKRSSREEKTLPGEKELEPITAMRLYNPQIFEGEIPSDLDPEQCMKELQERLKANELRQQDIDRQLQSLDDDDDDNLSDR